jgi:6-phosphogluconolactonase
LKGPYQPDELPSQLIKPTNGKLLWLVDAPAAKLL